MGVFRGSVFRVQERKAVLDAYHLTAEQYSPNQLAYDLRNHILRILNTEPWTLKTPIDCNTQSKLFDPFSQTISM